MKLLTKAIKKVKQERIFKMTREEYMELIGEDPEDTFGPDWENIIAEWEDK